MTSLPEYTDQVVVNRSAVMAEVRAAFERYETALVADDIATLNELFWDSPSSLRFGTADRQRGATEIHAWLRRHGGVPPGRRLRDTDVLTLDTSTAVVTTLFDYPDRPIEGQQTQSLGPLPPRLADHLSTRIRGARPVGATPLPAAIRRIE